MEPSDPLEDMYCETLKRRLISDFIISVFVFLVVTSVFLSTAFCRSVVSALGEELVKFETVQSVGPGSGLGTVPTLTPESSMLIMEIEWAGVLSLG